jgi:hypothetical protein
MVIGPWTIGYFGLETGASFADPAEEVFQVFEDHLDRLRRHPTSIEPDPAMGSDRARLISTGDGP